nr:Chain B, Peptide from Nuclear receptor coactivator 1 [Homo sapiens]
EHQLLRYLLDK